MRLGSLLQETMMLACLMTADEAPSTLNEEGLRRTCGANCRNVCYELQFLDPQLRLVAMAEPRYFDHVTCAR
jgi:hypothetical protein